MNSKMMSNLLAVGDCITLGVGTCAGNSYPERVGRLLGCTVTNKGLTMSTSREGVGLLRDNLTPDHDVVILQFGVADSHLTFRYAPYVLYYPDNLLRKTVRNIVKKYKKLAKRRGLNTRYGVRVVPEQEYRDNYLEMVRMCGDRLVILPETVPQRETFRNPAIRKYNRIIEQVADEQGCVYTRFFDEFMVNLDDYYLDLGHPNERGYEYITSQVAGAITHRFSQAQNSADRSGEKVT